MIDKDLARFAERLAKDLGPELVSLILFGSAASGEYSDHFSDVNLLCVVRAANPAALAAAGPAFSWWSARRKTLPVLVAEAELAGYARCFPIEFKDLKRSRRVLHGSDPVAGLELDDAYYRAEVEQELRSKLLRLRQRAGCVYHDKQLLTRLMADSFTTFLALGRHAVALGAGDPPASRAEVLAALESRFALDTGAFRTLMDVRDGALRGKTLDAAGLFARYLDTVERLVGAACGAESRS